MINNVLKTVFRRSSLARRAAYRLRGVEYVTDPAGLDKALRARGCDGGEIDAGGIARLSGICYALGASRKTMPEDPFSESFTAWQKNLYLEVSGRAGYVFGNEETPFDFEKQKSDFFPYNTKSPDFVGDQLMRQGFLIKNMRLPPESTIVEFGAGWGNTTLQLALMGHRVTAVEMNRDSIDLIRHRAAVHDREITIAPTDMLTFARDTDQRFDAALFVASFHHCDDHREMLRHLSRIVKKGGSLYFSEEPINPSSGPGLPYPWGLRLDGASLYYIRKYGWLELGFQESYFREALRREGWKLARIASPFAVVSDVYVATR